MKKTIFALLCLMANYGVAMDRVKQSQEEKERALEARMAAMRKIQERRTELAEQAKRREEAAKQKPHAAPQGYYDHRHTVVLLVIEKGAEDSQT